MDDKKLHYDAFISYKHMMPDRAVAERIQHKLENYRIPKEIAEKIGKKRLDRVFRDEAELSVSDDLSETITEALSNSDYLIVIASPKYLESPWCMKEVETFVKLKDRKHVLLVLADGEPKNAFPEILMYEEAVSKNENGEEIINKIEREPLAADCMASTVTERNKKVDNAVIRLIANIIDVNYDDLKQRHHEAIFKRRRNYGLAVVGILLGIIALSTYFLIKIGKQGRMILEKNEAAIAVTSGNLLAEGRRLDAIYAARSVLPDSGKERFNEEVAVALVHALEVYTPTGGYAVKNDYQVEAAISEADYSYDGSYAAIHTTNGETIVMNLTNKEEIARIETSDGTQILGFDGNEGLIYSSGKDDARYLHFESKEETPIFFYDIDKIVTLPNGSGVCIITSDNLAFYSSGELKFTVDFNELIPKRKKGDLPPMIEINEEENYGIMVFNFANRSYSCLAGIDFNTGDARMISKMDRLCYDAKCLGNRILTVACDISEESENSRWSTLIINKNTGNVIASTPSDESIWDCMLGDKMVVCVNEEDLIIYDNNLVEKSRRGLRDRVIYAQTVGNNKFIVTDVSGCVYLVSEQGVSTREIGNNRAKIYTGVKALRGNLYVNLYASNYITQYGRIDSGYLIPVDDFEQFPEEADYYKACVEFEDGVCENDPEVNRESIANGCVSSEGEIGVIQMANGQVRFYNRKNYDLINTTYAIDGFMYHITYIPFREVFAVSTEGCLYIFDKDLRHLISLERMSLVGQNTEHTAAVVMDADYNCYEIQIITYEQMIRKADEVLNGYEPDERTKERYGLL